MSNSSHLVGYRAVRNVSFVMRWPASDTVAFDCDSTLTQVEGIDELAAAIGLEAEVAELTNAAMDGRLDLSEVYGARLQLLQPTMRDVRSVRDTYKRNVVADARATIAALQAQGTRAVVVSGGLYEPVLDFSTWLGIDPVDVRAVNSDFDPLVGDWWANDGDAKYLDYRQGPLTQTRGKGELLCELFHGRARRTTLVGDGASDFEASSSVDLFVAYAGVVDRPAVTSAAPVVIRSPELAPLLALTLGPSHVRELATHPEFGRVARSCMELVSDGAITFNDNDLATTFFSAINHNWET